MKHRAFLALALVGTAAPAAAQEAPAPPAGPAAASAPSSAAPPPPPVAPAAAPAPLQTPLSATPSPPAGAPPAPPAVQPDRGPEPSSGIWMILGGVGLLAGGVGNFATSPLCLSSKIAASGHGGCLGLSLGFGIALSAGGLPLIVLGARQRRAWNEWMAGQRVGLAPVPGGAALAWGRSW